MLNEKSSFDEVAKTLEGHVDFKGEPFTAGSKVQSVNEAVFRIRMALCSRWITVKEAVPLIAMFPQTHPETACRLQAAIYVFSRIIDIEHFGQIQEMLTPEDRQELVNRLGIMNIFHPFAIDRRFDLDLGKRDEREIATILVNLAQHEPGENWKDETFGYECLQEKTRSKLFTQPYYSLLFALLDGTAILIFLGGAFHYTGQKMKEPTLLPEGA